MVSGRNILLMLLGTKGKKTTTEGVSGITRLQKLLFLLWKEGGVESVGDSFGFKPYKAGPYSKVLYDELELLENLGFISSEVSGESTTEEATELEELSFDQLMGGNKSPFKSVTSRSRASTADTFEERRFALTEKGVEYVEELLKKPDMVPNAEGIRKIVTKFADYSLQDLLYHVYTTYDKDGWTSESEIRDKVLRRGKKR